MSDIKQGRCKVVDELIQQGLLHTKNANFNKDKLLLNKLQIDADSYAKSSSSLMNQTYSLQLMIISPLIPLIRVHLLFLLLQ